MRSNALRVHDSDNVAVAVQRIAKGDTVVIGGGPFCQAAEDIELGHKVALAAIASGHDVVRYGEPIVRAACDIQRGQWVHVHNTQPVPGHPKE